MLERRATKLARFGAAAGAAGLVCLPLAWIVGSAANLPVETRVTGELPFGAALLGLGTVVNDACLFGALFAGAAAVGGPVLPSVIIHSFRFQRPAFGLAACYLAGGMIMAVGATMIPGGNDSLLLAAVPPGPCAAWRPFRRC